MRQLEVFFDYACPYCMRGHKNLVEITPHFPDVEILWRPCEAHPRPETYGAHSDLCIRGMFYAAAQGVDLWDYHARMYDAEFEQDVDIENPAALSGCVAGLMDPAAFQAMLESDAYKNELQQANDYAYEHSGVWAVPAYRMGGKKLDAMEDVGVSKEYLLAFLKGE